MGARQMLLLGDKACSECGEVKPLSEFYRNRRYAGGLVGKCKACARAKNVAVRARHAARGDGVAIPESKWCAKCGRAKPGQEFGVNRTRHDGRADYCRECFSAIGIGTRRTNKAADPKHSWRLTLRHKYGMSENDYMAMLARQGGVCAACGRPPRNGRALFVDHDHDTGFIRGLLHAKCNSALGFAEDSPEILRALAAYLDRHKRQEAKGA
jgi:hypothetical protein